MNEQEIMNKINEKTKNIPIPDSISPEAMKKMLDEQAKENPNTNKPTNFNRRRIIRGLGAAACMVLVLSGAWGLSNISKNSTTDSGVASFDATKEDVASDDCYVSDIANDTDAIENGVAASDTDGADQTDSPESTTIASNSSFHNPKSYEEFYNAAITANEKFKKEWAKYRSQIVDYDEEVYEETVAADEAPAVADEAPAEDTASAQKEYSQTNTQETAIDEGDIVKTDGDYIYRYSKKNSDINPFQIHIIKADSGKMTEVSTINSSNLPGCSTSSNFNMNELYLQNDKLIILYDSYDYLSTQLYKATYICTFDLKDKANPQLIGTLTQTGNYTTSRISDGYLYTISTAPRISYTREENYDAYVPKVNGEMVSTHDIFYCEDYPMSDVQVITAVDLNTPDVVNNTVAIPISSGNVYVSENSIYIYSNSRWDRSTQIMKVFYQKGNFIIGNETSFNGYLYGPFAINEYNGYLRIVATVPANSITRNEQLTDLFNKMDKPVIDVTGNVNQVTNVLYILDSDLKLTGSISNIAPNEQIYSARFMGDTGYFVTYRNTDPLFSVDLSDPQKPTLLGALKIPGFSTYLHPYGDGILFGLGKETDPETGRFEGLKLSMFNINDPTNVMEENKLVLKDCYFSSSLTNYKAIMIDTEKNIFGFSYQTDYGAFRFATYTYDDANGFTETGNYDISELSQSLTSDYARFDGDASIRGVYIGDYLYISADSMIESFQLYKNDKLDEILFEQE